MYKKYASKSKLLRAKNAQKLIKALGSPTLDNAKAMIKRNLVKDCPVTCKDSNIVYDIYGANQGNIKGKLICRNNKIKQHKKIQIPPDCPMLKIGQRKTCLF